jgi:hypothetical protein
MPQFKILGHSPVHWHKNTPQLEEEKTLFYSQSGHERMTPMPGLA